MANSLMITILQLRPFCLLSHSSYVAKDVTNVARNGIGLVYSYFKVGKVRGEGRGAGGKGQILINPHPYHSVVVLPPAFLRDRLFPLKMEGEEPLVEIYPKNYSYPP
ncbi:hypothetical protein [Saccharicrinis carchari]|nr:hypothetical protein [Saccharicrinis carchari]